MPASNLCVTLLPPSLVPQNSVAGITGTVPPELFNLISLTHFDIGVNAMSGSIPFNIGWVKYPFQHRVDKVSLST